MLYDTGRERCTSTRCASTPDDPGRAMVIGAPRALRERGRRAGRARRGLPRDDRRDERRARAPRRRGRHGDDEGLPRRRAHRPPPAPAALLDHAGHPLAGTAVRQAPPPARGRRADRAADRARCSSRSTRTRSARPPARCKDGGRRVGRRLLPLLVPEPGARAAGGGDRRARRCRARSSPRAPTSSRSSASSSASRPRAMNAFVGPSTGRYLERLAGALAARGRAGEAARDDVERRRRVGRDGGARSR